MGPLHRKLSRDLWRLRGQVITIALVVASGVAAFVTMRSAHAALLDSRATFYESARFADVFAHLRRAPEAVVAQLEAIEGVASVEARVVTQGAMPMEDMTEPASMTVLSIPERHNRIHLLRGRMPEADRPEEVVLSDAFADAHALSLGDTLSIVIGGVRQRLTLVGVGLSPEYVITLQVGDMAMDARKTGVLFMNGERLAESLQMQGAFNDVSLRLLANAREEDVKDAVDEVLAPYGGLGAIGRTYQASNFMLDQELAQLGSMASNLPPLFLMVAAFLLNVVLSRLVQLQRPQVAALKALGYYDREIGTHYLLLALSVVTLGSLLGLAFGAWMTDGMVGLYAEYFRFPALSARIAPRTAALAVVVSFGAALVGTVTSVRSVLSLRPAEAMRPAAPAKYRRGLLSRLPGLSPAARMIAREVERRPMRLLLSAAAISVAVGLMVVGQYLSDAMNYLMDTYLHQSQQWDVQVVFGESRPARSLGAVGSMPGVFHAEGIRQVPVEVRHQAYSRRLSLTAYEDEGQLQRVVDEAGHVVPIPEDGAMLTALLAERLHLEVGDTIEIEVLEGRRRTVRAPVVALVDELMGLQVHMQSAYYHRLVGEEPTVSAALLRIDPAQADALDRRLSDLRDVVSVTHMDRVLTQFREQSGRNIGVMSFIMALFASIIAIGVVYNNARVALSMRSRDLASLRVLGFRRAEVAAILIGELSIQVLLAIPVGLLFGKAMAIGMATGATDPEVYRLPVVVSLRTYAVAALLTLGSAVVSAWLVRRKLYGLDLIGVLKTRE